VETMRGSKHSRHERESPVFQNYITGHHSSFRGLNRTSVKLHTVSSKSGWGGRVIPIVDNRKCTKGRGKRRRGPRQRNLGIANIGRERVTSQTREREREREEERKAVEEERWRIRWCLESRNFCDKASCPSSRR